MEDTSSKKEKGLRVCFPDLDASTEDREVAVRILDNYIENHEREETKTDITGHSTVDAGQ